jgi:hypothetical protein
MKRFSRVHASGCRGKLKLPKRLIKLLPGEIETIIPGPLHHDVSGTEKHLIFMTVRALPQTWQFKML